MTNAMTKDKIFQEIAKISAGYTVFQCVDCANAIKDWLKQNSINGIHLQISAVGRMKFIISSRWRGGQESIAQTGIHQGIETHGRVFDNLSPKELDRANWIADFDCASGESDVTELELF